MHWLCFVMVIAMSASSVAQRLRPPFFISDPSALSSKTKADVERLSIEKLFMTRSIAGTAWSPDGQTIAFVSNMSGRYNLWTVPASGGWPVQLTISDQRQYRPAWSPDGKWIVFQSDQDGDEQWDLFLVSPRNGKVINLTKTPDVAEEAAEWSPDSRKLAYMAKPRTASSFEIDVLDTYYHTVQHVTSGSPKDHGNFSPLWSPDGKQIA